jgi:hypothetical protein
MRVDTGAACGVCRGKKTIMTTTTNEVKRITVTMSELRPLSIIESDWPVIASAEWFNGEHECQANTIRRIRVREHADGRRLVYGFTRAGNGGQHAGARNPSGGFLIDPCPRATPDDEETIRAIRRVGGILGDDDLAAECIADMPAEEQ